MKIRTSYTGCPYITAGKIYEVISHYKGFAEIYADCDIDISAKLYGTCAHLNDVGTWEIVPESTYANNLTKAADHLAEALTLLRAASAVSDTALQRAAARHMLEPATKLHASVYELACAAQDTPR